MPGRLWRFSCRVIANLIRGSLSEHTQEMRMVTTSDCTSNGFLQALDVVFTAENFLFSLEESESESEVGNASPYLFLLPLQFVERSLEFV